MWVGNIACSKHTFDIGRCSLTGCDDVALSIEVDLSAENIGVWLVSDSKEESIDGNIESLLVGLAFKFHKVSTFYTSFAKKSHCVGVEKHFDIWSGENTLFHHIGSAEIVFAHYHIHFFRKSAQIHSLFASGVAAANHCHCLFAIEEAIASGARRHAHSRIFLLIVETEIFCRSTGGDNYRVGKHCGAVFDCERKRTN